MNLYVYLPTYLPACLSIYLQLRVHSEHVIVVRVPCFEFRSVTEYPEFCRVFLQYL